MAKRLKNTEEEKWMCYIEALPDEILMDILSKLRTREAAATHMISRRWRNLDIGSLTWCSRNLDLDFTDKKYKLEYIRESVAYVLNKHCGDVDNMRIAFHHDDNPDLFHCTCREWLLTANRIQVQSLDIQVKSSKPLEPSHEYHKRSHLQPLDAKLLFNSWERLTTLCLKSVVVDRFDMFQLSLSKFPNLETFLLENTPVAELMFTQHIPKLKRFEAQNCATLCWISIRSAPNLKSFKHIAFKNKHGHAPKLQLFGLGLSPYLEDVYLGGPLCRYMMSSLQHNAPQLQKLQLDMGGKCDDHHNCWESDIVTFPTLGNVKQLMLSFTCTRQMDMVIAIIRACPCLEKLTLKYEIQEAKEGDPKSKNTRQKCLILNSLDVNECLKTIEIFGWSGLKPEVRFIRHLIHTSPSLQDLLLDHKPPIRIS